MGVEKQRFADANFNGGEMILIGQFLLLGHWEGSMSTFPLLFLFFDIKIKSWFIKKAQSYHKIFLDNY